MSIPTRAFPNSKFNNDETNGMELRDYFAARAMEKFTFDKLPHGIMSTKECIAYDATRCYEIADAMMEARKK